MLGLKHAIAYAFEKHKGQLDKSNQPFIGHPLRVMARLASMYSEPVLMAAVLHDVAEDCATNPEDRVSLLTEIGTLFGEEVGKAVIILTHVKEEDGATYFEYIGLCARHEIARVVKIADIEDNMDPHRQWGGAPLERYAKALNLLRDSRYLLRDR